MPVRDPVLDVRPLGFVWDTLDPFRFCVHHDDRYPRGNSRFGPQASLAGRNLGNDFELRDGWRMYHGEVVPGFPSHPHRGFETVTVVRHGLIDHADSMGAAARYGRGDVQWLTAGSGIVHAEMFPLLRNDAENPVELFQIWLNLPRADKMVAPHFKMLWADQIPTVIHDPTGKRSLVTVVAGELGGTRPPAPPPSSWASRPEADVAIWTLQLQPHASLILPSAKPGTNRMLYAFSGGPIHVGAREVEPGARGRRGATGPVGLCLQGDAEVPIQNGAAASELLLLQGRPIGEPVVAQGPFVMNTPSEIQQAYADYRRTGFGGWPWSSRDPVHGPERGRFARRAGGEEEVPA